MIRVRKAFDVSRSVTLLGICAFVFSAHGQEADQPGAAATPGAPAVKQTAPSEQADLPARTAGKLTARGANYLIATQDKDGGWASSTGPGVSALVLKALVQQPTVGPEHPAVKRGLEFIFRFQHDDGGIYSGDGLLKNYESAVTLMLLARVKDPTFAAKIKNLQGFLKDGQWDEGEDISRDNVFYGGAGYGRHKRPDLSNTQLMLEALHDSGLPKDDPAYKKALVFIQRCQMQAEVNDQPFAKGSTQGGFIYSPANGGETRAGEIEIEGRTELRCFGTMSYAGFKSLLYAGLTKDDPRVKAALEWIRRNWTLDANPNMPGGQSQEGLFYYYHTFGRTLEAWNEDSIKDAQGRDRDWRRELLEALAKRQRPDGSWINNADRYYEGNPELTTAYSMLALQAAYPQQP